MAAVVAIGVAFCARAATDATDIVRKVDHVLWGETTWAGEFEMSVVRPEWRRTLVVKNWARRPGKSFARITSPAKDAGTGSLVLGTEMWNYMPSIERTVKIPPSMMLQPWMGSDVTNDDIMEQGSLLTKYNHKLLRETTLDGAAVYEVELVPKPDMAVTWGRIVLVARTDMVPLRQSFYDERGALVRELVFSDTRMLGGHALPTHWEIRPASKPGQMTVIQIRSAAFDQPLAEDIFSLRNLARKE